MSEVLGIGVGHGERITSENWDYRLFFEMVRTFDWRTEPIDEPFRAETLARYRNILVGEPHREFTPEEVKSVHEWVADGGNLLVISSIGGDAAPGGNVGERTNLGELAGGISFNSDALGIDKGVTKDESYDTNLHIDIRHLVGTPATLHFMGGCSLTLAPAGRMFMEMVLRAPPYTVRIDGGISHKNLRWPPVPSPASGSPVLVHYRWGKGRVTAFGSSASFLNETITREDNVLFLNWVIIKTFDRLVANYIHHYSQLPQRHRLLHGYPFPNLMQNLPDGHELQRTIESISNKPVIIGVLPHTSCNPMVKGCGFCTFPHEPFNADRVRSTVKNVLTEIDRFADRYRWMPRQPVKAIYFGGGTANLTPTDLFQDLCHKLAEIFETRVGEVTLEGVPAYFEKEAFRYLDILREQFRAWRWRISMGVQTFDSSLIRKMGRGKFGDEACIRRIAQKALEAGFQVSGDLLFNLPGQSIESMKADVARLVEMGFTQISLYHLVMFRTLGPEWSKDREILSALPDNVQALENWLVLRNELTANGYRQKTLTNFEKDSEHPFDYERCVFCPEENNWVGFGPSAISFFSNDAFSNGLKLLNPETAAEYNRMSGATSWTRYYQFDPIAMKVLYITRKIALLGLDKKAYQALFSSSIDEDFAGELHHLTQSRLISIDGDHIAVTDKGCFFADTIAGVFALRKTRHHKMMALFSNKTSLDDDMVDPRLEAQEFRMG